MAVKAMKPAAVVIVALAVIIAAYLLLYGEKTAPEFVETTGVVEATEAELASKIPGRIDWLCCREGDSVASGAVAVRLDARELQARLLEGRAAATVANEAIAEARIARENAVAERESAVSAVEAAKAEVDRAAALYQEARENMDRAERLFKDGYIAKRDLDSARAAHDSNLALLNSARARARSVEASLRSATVAIRAAEARTATSQARSQEAAAQVRVFEAQLQDTEIHSPVTGIISYKAFEVGEYVTPGAAIYNVYASGDIWTRVDIEETRIQNIAIGSRAVITPAGGGREFAGSVAEIGELGGFATQRDVTRGRSDIKTFRVKIRVENGEGLLKPGMTVSARIFPKQAQNAGDRDR